MPAFLKRRQSWAALWCQRLAVFLLFYFLVTIAGQRWRLIDTPSVLGLLGIGLVFTLIALGLGMIGMYHLWQFGHKGGMQSVRGILLAILMIVPYGWAGWLAFTLPPLNDISTDRFAPPAFEQALDLRTKSMNKLDDLSEIELESQAFSYPHIGSRRYTTSTDRVFLAVKLLIESRGWKIVGQDVSNTTDLIDIEGSINKKEKQSSSTFPSLRPEQPETKTDETTAESKNVDSDADINVSYLESVANSLIMRFPDDVVVRIVEEDGGALVDMRSSSRWGVHDLGGNAARIAKFMRDLDVALAGVAGEG